MTDKDALLKKSRKLLDHFQDDDNCMCEYCLLCREIDVLLAEKDDSSERESCPRCYGDGPHAECSMCNGTGYVPLPKGE